MVLNTLEILDTLQDFIRSSDCITTTSRQVTTTTEQFSGDNIETQFTLLNVPHNIRSCTIDAQTLYNYKDFTTDYSTGVITFNTAPASGTNNIEISYDYGSSGDKIYSDYPRNDLNIDSYPRVGFDIISNASEDWDIQHTIINNSLIIQIVAYGRSKSETQLILDTLRESIFNNRKNIGNFRLVTFNGLGPMLITDRGENQIFQRNLDIILPLETEGDC
jgi:hypothetical protein